jgi:hypothetical protein
MRSTRASTKRAWTCYGELSGRFSEPDGSCRMHIKDGGFVTGHVKANACASTHVAALVSRRTFKIGVAISIKGSSDVRQATVSLERCIRYPDLRGVYNPEKGHARSRGVSQAALDPEIESFEPDVGSRIRYHCQTDVADQEALTRRQGSHGAAQEVRSERWIQLGLAPTLHKSTTDVASHTGMELENLLLWRTQNLFRQGMT